MAVNDSWLNFQLNFANFFIRRFWLLIVLYTFFIFFCALFLVFLPKYNLYELQKNVELPQQQEQLRLEQVRVNQAKESRTEFAKIKNDPILQKLVQSLPENKDTAHLFVMLDDLAKQSNLRVIAINITEDLSDISNSKPKLNGNTSNGSGEISGLHKLRVNLTVTGGGYTALKNFLEKAESSLRLIDVNSLSFNPAAAEVISYYINFTTYYLAQ